jgi:uncharacterized protein YkwD
MGFEKFEVNAQGVTNTVIALPDSFVEEASFIMLNAHNLARTMHRVNSLVMTDELQTSAQKYSQYLATIAKLQHSYTTGIFPYGESLYFSCKYMTFHNATCKWT